MGRGKMEEDRYITVGQMNNIVNKRFLKVIKHLEKNNIKHIIERKMGMKLCLKNYKKMSMDHKNQLSSKILRTLRETEW